MQLDKGKCKKKENLTPEDMGMVLGVSACWGLTFFGKFGTILPSTIDSPG
jgi:hypothetical protein